MSKRKLKKLKGHREKDSELVVSNLGKSRHSAAEVGAVGVDDRRPSQTQFLRDPLLGWLCSLTKGWLGSFTAVVSNLQTTLTTIPRVCRANERCQTFLCIESGSSQSWQNSVSEVQLSFLTFPDQTTMFEYYYVL